MLWWLASNLHKDFNRRISGEYSYVMTVPPSDGQRLRPVSFLILGLVVGLAGLCLFLHFAKLGVSDRIATFLSGRSTTYATAPVIVRQMQQLSRLETVSYSLDTVVEGRESSPIFPDALAGDRLLMIVHGKNVAGIDMSKLRSKDIVIDDLGGKRHIKITLPPPEIFQTSIDDEKSRVYERSTGLFVRADPNLETQTRLSAQKQLQQAALSDGILDAATKNASITLTSMLHGFGFAEVEVR